MRKLICIVSLLSLCVSLAGQSKPLKSRPDAFPPAARNGCVKGVAMARSVEEMKSWSKYPTYEVYLGMMTRWAEKYGNMCRVDTIGLSTKGRLILSLYIDVMAGSGENRPEFFYSSTMHGDELTGYVMMLRLIDTLLEGYGQSERYTRLLNNVRVSINPLSNPDGAYWGGDSTVGGAMRFNANYVDLNRNFPDPFGTESLDTLQDENRAMMRYVAQHRFVMSANLHGGSEVFNYPWDSFTSSQQRHPQWQWWESVGKRFVDSCRLRDINYMSDVCVEGYIAGGDWYVIPNGRQDYMNHFLSCRESTIELSTEKTLMPNMLPVVWKVINSSLVGYIEEVLSLPDIDVSKVECLSSLSVYPNPVSNMLYLSKMSDEPIAVFDQRGRLVLRIAAGVREADMSSLAHGVYVLRCGTWNQVIVKR